MKKNTKKLLTYLLLVCMVVQVVGNAGLRVQAKDLNTWINPILSPDDREDVSDNEQGDVSGNGDLIEVIQPEEKPKEEPEEKPDNVLIPIEQEEAFVLGNDVNNILYVTNRVSDGKGEYVSKEDGIYYEIDNSSTKVNNDVAYNLNLYQNFLYYTTKNENGTHIKKQNLQGKEIETIFEVATPMKQMYLVNGEKLYYLSDDDIYCYDLLTGRENKLRDGNNIFSFIVYKHGLLVAEGTCRDYDLYVDDQLMDSHVRSYSLIDNQYLFYSTSDKVSKIDLQKKYVTKNVNGVIQTTYEQDLVDIGAEVVDVGALLEAVSMSPCESNECYDAGIESTTASISMPAGVSQGQINMVKNARQIVEIEWTCLKDVMGWRGLKTFYAGETYKGIPYGQPYKTDSYVPNDISFTEFIAETENENSNFYMIKGTFPYYSGDCSALVSHAWDISRNTTSTLRYEATVVENISDIQVGDAIIKYIGEGENNHTMLIGEVEYGNNANVTKLRIYEQTPSIAITYEISYDDFKNKYINKQYKLYRYKKVDNVEYNHDCAVPIDGDTCKICGPNVTFESDKVTVYKGYPQKINVTATPTNAKITWKSTNTNIATVDQNGVVTGKKAGTVNIRATVEGVSKVCKVTVKNPTVKFTSKEKEVYKGYKINLAVETAPENQKVEWKSSNTGIATVDPNGRVTGVKKGTAKITASFSGASKTITITVKNPTLELDKTSLTVYTGYTGTIKATPTPSAEKVTWSSSNTGIATVNSSGVVTGIKKGKATITAIINDSEKTCTVTVKEPTLKLDKTSMTVYVGYTGTIKATPKPSAEKVTWSSSDSSIATVNSSGVVTGIKKGKVTITASTKNTTKKCTVKVKEPTLSIDKTSMTVYKGYTGTIKATPKPSNGKVTWKSADTSVATVNSNGVVTGKKVGTTTITATIGKVTKTCIVTVSTPSVNLNKTQLTVYAGYTASLTATTKPAGAGVTWKSSNTSVATVNSSGVITGKKTGTAIITASINGASKQCSVTVKSPSLTITPASMIVYRGYDGTQNQIQTTSTPAAATRQYKSNNTAIATVTSSGLVMGVKAGNTKIIVSIPGATKECSVTVKNPTLTISQTSMTLKKGRTGQLRASVAPSYATVTWTSSDTSIATVNSKGLVTAKKAGSVVITAKINGMSRICNVRVTN